jgi:DedD protein
VFLVIVIGAALLIFGTQNSYTGAVANRPIAAGSPSVAYTVPDALPYGNTQAVQPETKPNGETQGPGIVVITEGTDNSVPANNGSGNGVSTNGGSASNGASSASTPANTVTENSTVISISRPTTAAVPDTTPPPVSASAAQTAPARSTPTVSSSNSTQPAATVSSSALGSASSSSTATATVAASAAVKSPTDYWVQAGSFSTLSRAEGVKTTLLDKGFASIIENRTIDGTMYYRVRIGPYTSKSEADHWLALVQSINGFEQSQVWQSQ